MLWWVCRSMGLEHILKDIASLWMVAPGLRSPRVIDQVLWEHNVTLSMPFKKPKHTVQWQQQDLPTIPLLMNPKGIKQRQRLVVYQAPPKTEVVDREKKK